MPNPSAVLSIVLAGVNPSGLAAMKLRDRIKDLRRVKGSDLLPNPKNWRTHPTEQRDALRGVLAQVGIADALLARETPAGLMLIEGHARAEEEG